MTENEWSQDFPQKPGRYWFYGDPLVGTMGIDYTEDYEFKPDLYHVIISEIGNGLTAVTDGYFMATNKFDKKKHKQGYIGLFSKIFIPVLPTDFKQ